MWNGGRCFVGESYFHFYRLKATSHLQLQKKTVMALVGGDAELSKTCVSLFSFWFIDSFSLDNFPGL